MDKTYVVTCRSCGVDYDLNVSPKCPHCGGA